MLTELVENLLNRNLGASPRARELCAALRGRRLRITLNGLGVRIGLESLGSTLRIARDLRVLGRRRSGGSARKRPSA